MRNLLYFVALAGTLVLSSFSPAKKEASLEGTWVRKSDHLVIKVTPEGTDQLRSFIIEEGREKFPCEVKGLPIYKNIVSVDAKHWTCDFLVVTMGSCKTEYQRGEIHIVKTGDMVVICPGFEAKVYEKLKPRYDRAD